MPALITGSLYLRKNGWHARLTLAPKVRKSFHLTTCATEEEARARLAVLVDVAGRLRGHERLEAILRLVGQARTGNDLDTLLRHVAATQRGELVPRSEVGKTFRQVGEMWTSGEIAAMFPDRVHVKTNAWKDVGLLEKHVYPILGPTPIAELTLDDADAVMRALPASYASGSRKQIAMLISRVLGLAAFPLKLIAASPLPKGWIPKRGPGKALSYLYPDEDARLLGCERVPLPLRIYYGFLDREGMRGSEAEALEWPDVDLERGAVVLDKNKTSDRRAWALSPGVVRALRLWKEIQREEYGECSRVFLDEDGEPIETLHHKHRAESFRAHLLLARVERPALHERSPERRPIRAHDLRATFITIALATGKTEAWVADRTGHRSSHMINRYRRAARTVGELGLGDLAPLDEMLPELRARSAQERCGTASGTAAATDRAAQGKKPRVPPLRSSRPGSWRGTAGGNPRTAQPEPTTAISAGKWRGVKPDRVRSRMPVPHMGGRRARSRAAISRRIGHLVLVSVGADGCRSAGSRARPLAHGGRLVIFAEAADHALDVGDLRAAQLIVKTIRRSVESQQRRMPG